MSPIKKPKEIIPILRLPTMKQKGFNKSSASSKSETSDLLSEISEFEEERKRSKVKIPPLPLNRVYTRHNQNFNEEYHEKCDETEYTWSRL